jgi:hypothetical protein
VYTFEQLQQHLNELMQGAMAVRDKAYIAGPVLDTLRQELKATGMAL